MHEPRADAAGPGERPDAAHIGLCLLSHTNAGKTTLARTLLGRDVGEVRDAAHVTQLAEAHELLATSAGDTLRLWDTPGFGDSARLVRRLGAASNPVGWFLSQVWDRWTDRPFFLTQQALRATRDHADVVLYLVNATEPPQDAGYLEAELRLLAWLGKPALALVNQTGRAEAGRAGDPGLQAWVQRLGGEPAVAQVLPLDAFTRCWVHEQAFFDAVGRVLPPGHEAGWRRLQAAWQARNEERFHASMAALATQLAEAAQACQRVQLREGEGLAGLARRVLGGAQGDARQRGQQALEDAVQAGRTRTTRALLALHGLQGRAEHPFLQRLDRGDFVARAPLDPVRAGVGGALASGAATGLAADLAAGGLTLGAGALLGAISGAIAFAVGAQGANRASGVNEPTVQLGDAALRALLQDALLKYAAIAHFGRGQGAFEQQDVPPAWGSRMQALVQAHAGELDALFARLREPRASGQDGAAPGEPATEALQRLAGALALAFLAGLYPGADLRRVGAEALATGG